MTKERFSSHFKFAAKANSSGDIQPIGLVSLKGTLGNGIGISKEADGSRLLGGVLDWRVEDAAFNLRPPTKFSRSSHGLE